MMINLAEIRGCDDCAARASLVWGAAYDTQHYACADHKPAWMIPGTPVPDGGWARSLTPASLSAPHTTGHLGVTRER